MEKNGKKENGGDRQRKIIEKGRRKWWRKIEGNVEERQKETVEV